ncbi:MAG: DoxX family protein [Candidatus Omnitrophica bacterium]|nr:DoxX family protein [Candidatus Omnitrophota bacterium]
MKGWGSLPLRLGLGIMFAAHGLQQAFGMLGGPGLQGFAKMLSNMGFGPSVFWAGLAAYSELIGGLCLILGIFTRLATIPLLIFMLVAVIKVHLAKGFFLSAGGYEYNFIIVCGLISLLITGPGKFSLTKKF